MEVYYLNSGTVETNIVPTVCTNENHVVKLVANRTSVPKLFSVMGSHRSLDSRLYESFLLNEIRVDQLSLLKSWFHLLLLFDIRSAFPLRYHVNLFILLGRYHRWLSDQFQISTTTVLLEKSGRVVTGLQSI